MSHYTGVETTLQTKTIHEESEANVKFKAKTVSGNAEITEVEAKFFTFAAKGAEVKTLAGVVPAGTTVESFNESAKTAVLSQKLEKSGAAEELELVKGTFPVLPYQWFGWPQQVDFAEYISGNATGSKKGKVAIEQCFNLPSPSEGLGMVQTVTLGSKTVTLKDTGWEQRSGTVTEKTVTVTKSPIEEWAEKGTWVLASWAEWIKGGETLAEWPVNNSSAAISAFAGAPWWRASFTSEEAGNKIKVYAHAFERGRV